MTNCMVRIGRQCPGEDAYARSPGAMEVQGFLRWIEGPGRAPNTGFQRQEYNLRDGALFGAVSTRRRAPRVSSKARRPMDRGVGVSRRRLDRVEALVKVGEKLGPFASDRSMGVHA